ncbi:MAG: signal recognition particle protein [Clostridia bacterium]|nr:signal recognition particle protein [Clostridia bacterium]
MAFESLGDKLQGVFKKLRGKGRVSEKDIKDAMREVRLALLEADVNFKVAREFIAKVSEKAVGADVLESLTPAQQIIKIVRDELIALMGGTEAKLAVSSKPPTILMLVGLNGAGKTTTAAKLAAHLKKIGKRPLLAACDVYRPAAVRQLMVVGEQVGVPVFTKEGEKDPIRIAEEAVRGCDLSRFDTVILDTAGRLQVDEALMDELVRMKDAVHPTEILLVVDAMTGQDAVNIAEGFNETVGIDGVILTKMDGDTRGGAALSVKAVTGKPIKFSCIGEKLTDIEPFYPDRLASRILGMGDMLTLIDKAQAAFDEKTALQLEQKLRAERFTLQDFLDQMEQMKKIGSIGELMSMMPGMNQKALQGAEIDERQVDRTGAIIKSMTPAERENPQIINASRKRRIAAGSGMQVQDVNRLLKQFDDMQKLMKQFMGKGKKRMRFPFGLR